MTQEEKIEIIERERDAWQCDADDHKKRGCIAHYEHEQAMANALTEAINALRGPQPDPETGLCKCGCGGYAISMSWIEDTLMFYYLCQKCQTQTGMSRTRKEAVQRWNRAMGYKES